MKYQLLKDEDPEESLNIDNEKELTNHRKSPRRPYWALFHIIVLFLYTSFFAISIRSQHNLSEKECATKLSSWSPALEAVRYEETTFDGRVFGAGSPYKGPPSPELDAAWDRVSLVEGFVLPKDGLEKIHKGEDVVPVGDEGYYAILEVYHQLHCLNMIRKATHRDYYPLPYSEHETRVHLDHCVDILRIALMCHGDVSVITHNWVEGFDVPRADFSTFHKCRNFDSILDWSHAHQGHWNLSDVRDWRKPDAKVLPHDP